MIRYVSFDGMVECWWKMMQIGLYPSTFKAYSRIVLPPHPRSLAVVGFMEQRLVSSRSRLVKAFILFIMLPLFLLA